MAFGGAMRAAVPFPRHGRICLYLALENDERSALDHPLNRSAAMGYNQTSGAGMDIFTPVGSFPDRGITS
jgi:hypothetical protein